MKLVSLAVSGSILLLTFAVPSNSQTTPQQLTSQLFADGDRSIPIPMQAPSQVSNTTAPPGAVRALSQEEMGDLFMARKQYFEAAQAYKNLSDQNPRNAVYLNKLGIALHQQEALGLALKCYQRALKVNPHYADAENNIGTIWYQRKKYSKAIRAYERAIKMRDDMAVLYSNLGYAYFGSKKYEESITAFRTALAKDPQLFEHNSSRSGSLLQDRSVSDRGRFYFLLAKSFAQSGNVERAVLYLRKAKDEGYASLVADLKKDKAFAAELQIPEIQDMLAPKSADTEQP
jgi:tetratricopeptide (TPR) repeat protein